MKENDLTAMLREKKELLLQLLDVDKAIKDSIYEENIEKLNKKLEHRQYKLNQLEEFGKKFDEERSLDSSVHDLVKDIETIISEAKKADKENKVLAEDMLNKYRVQIRNLNQTKKKIGGYTQAGKNSDGYFVDAKK